MNTLHQITKTDHSLELNFSSQERACSGIDLDAFYKTFLQKELLYPGRLQLLKPGMNSMIYGTDFSDKIVVKVPVNSTAFLNKPKADVERYIAHLNNLNDALEIQLPPGWILKQKMYAVKSGTGYIPIQLQEKCMLYFEDRIINCCGTYYELTKSVSLKQYVDFHSMLFSNKGKLISFETLIKYNWHSTKLFELLHEDEELNKNAAILLKALIHLLDKHRCLPDISGCNIFLMPVAGRHIFKIASVFKDDDIDKFNQNLIELEKGQNNLSHDPAFLSSLLNGISLLRFLYSLATATKTEINTGITINRNLLKKLYGLPFYSLLTDAHKEFFR